MKKFLNAIDWYVKGAFIVAILLLIASFILPPLGIIDESVLKAVLEIESFSTVIVFLYKLPEYIKNGSTKFKKGDLEVEISNNKKDDVEYR